MSLHGLRAPSRSPRHRRTVEHRAFEAGAGEIGIDEAGAGEIGAGEIGLDEGCHAEIDAFEAGTAQIDAGEIGGPEAAGRPAIGPADLDRADLRAVENGARKLRLREIDAVERRFAQIRFDEIGAREIRHDEPAAPQKRAFQAAFAEIGAAEIDGGEVDLREILLGELSPRALAALALGPELMIADDALKILVEARDRQRDARAFEIGLGEIDIRDVGADEIAIDEARAFDIGAAQIR